MSCRKRCERLRHTSVTGIGPCLHLWRVLELQINAGEKKEGKEDAPSTAAPAPGTGKAVDFAKISIEEAFTTLKVQLLATAQSANPTNLSSHKLAILSEVGWFVLSTDIRIYYKLQHSYKCFTQGILTGHCTAYTSLARCYAMVRKQSPRPGFMHREPLISVYSRPAL